MLCEDEEGSVEEEEERRRKGGRTGNSGDVRLNSRLVLSDTQLPDQQLHLVDRRRLDRLSRHALQESWHLTRTRRNAHDRLLLDVRLLSLLVLLLLLSLLSLRRERMRTGVVTVRNDTEDHVASVILHLPLRHLPLHRNTRHASELREGVVHLWVRPEVAVVRRVRWNGTVAVDVIDEGTADHLRRDLGVADADRADFGTEYLAAVKGFASGGGVVEAFEVDELQLRDRVSVLNSSEGRKR